MNRQEPFLRESRKISMRRAASIIGVSEAIVNHAENGRVDITPTLITKFVKAYGYEYLQFEQILNGKVDIPEHTLSECIGILKRLTPEKLKTVKTILESF